MTRSDRAVIAGHDGPVLLDTHIWMWMLNGDERRMSPACVDLLRRLFDATLLRVSDISVWEVAVKVAKGRLALAPDLETWLYEAERKPGIDFVSVDRQTFLLSTQLPSPVHPDPADRILMATAHLLDYPLVTVDREIVAYADTVGGFSVIDARQ